MTISVLLWILAAGCVVVGLTGTIVPVLPGAPLIFAGLVVAAWIDDFQRVTWVTLVLLGFLTLLSLAVDFVATALGARRVGATRLAVIGAFLGSLVGIVFGIVGLLLGPFIGAVAGEMLSHGEIAQASRVGVATWIALIVAAIAKLALALAMIGLFAAAYFS